ncbi:hypothetical protein A2U01_0073651, partial [Trifolium medium]|nr:hypothetical protein [Trifolium medium]
KQSPNLMSYRSSTAVSGSETRVDGGAETVLVAPPRSEATSQRLGVKKRVDLLVESKSRRGGNW